MQQKGIKLNTILTKSIIIPSGQLKSGMYEITSANMSRILKKPMQQISIIATKQKHIPIDSLFSFLWVLGYIIQVKNSDDVIFYMGEKWDIHCFIINCYHLYKHVININDSRKNQQILLIILPIILNYPKNYTLQMQTSAQSRKNRMASIRASLQQNPVMKKNTQTLQSKIAKKSKRKESLKLDNIQNTIEIDLNAMADKQDKPGSVGKFHQKYQLGDKIGQGSNGLVRKCYLRSTNQIYAVKEINMDEQHIMFLKANFKYIKQLNHPNIIRYHVMYLDNRKKTCYLVMDYDTNPCLLKFHDLCQLEIKGIIFQLINTLVYVHSQNICHRDIKPENILYDRGNKKIKIIDFGISKKIVERGAKREMLTITGTLYYRAPEMFLGGGYDEKVDLWASGVTLYQLLSQGRTPFQSDYLSTTIENITRGEVQYPEEIWNKYDKFAKDLVSRLLKKSSQRLTALQARRHFWFEDQNYEGIDITKSDTFFKSVSPTKNPKKTFKQDGSFKFQRSLTNTFKIQPDEKPSSDRKQSMLKKWLAGSDDDDVLVDIESEEQENIMQRQPSYAQQ